MTKFLISIFVLFAFFGIIDTASAEIVQEADFTCDGSDYQCISCSYDTMNYHTVYYVKSDGIGNANVTFSTETEYASRMNFNINSSATSSDFYNESQGKLVCPNTIYTKFSGGGININIDMRFSEAEDYHPYDIVSQEDNGLDYLSGSLENEPIMCSVPAVDAMNSNQPLGWDATVRVDGNGVVSFEVNSEYEVGWIADGITASMFQNGCPDDLMVTCGGNQSARICNLTFEDLSGSHGGSGEPDDPFNPVEVCQGDNCNISMREICTDSNVSNTLRSIGIIIVIIKILVPAVIIIVGIKNLFMIITSGKEDDVKKYAKSIAIRVVIGVVIFLIPGIINFIYDAAQDVIGGGQPNDFDNCWNCLFDIDQCDTSGQSD